MENYLKNLLGKDYKDLSAKEFSNLVIYNLELNLKNYFISKEVFVSNRGDGHFGRIDIVISFENSNTIAIELDRLKPRKKSIFKLQTYNATESYIITRSPVKIIKING